jgi:hypothetical protein
MKLCRKIIVPQIGSFVKGDGEIFKFGFIELFERVKMPMTVNSPTACGRSPLGEGALGRGAKSLIG